MRMPLIAFKKVVLVRVHKNMIWASTYSLWWSYTDSEREDGSPKLCILPLKCILSITCGKNWIDVKKWCKLQWMKLGVVYWFGASPCWDGGWKERWQKSGDFLQNEWERVAHPRTYWNQLPTAKFGLESNGFLLGFCVGKATQSSGNRDVCSPPVSDPGSSVWFWVSHNFAVIHFPNEEN